VPSALSSPRGITYGVDHPVQTTQGRNDAMIGAKPVLIAGRLHMTTMDDQIARHIKSMILRVAQKRLSAEEEMLYRAIRALRSQPLGCVGRSSQTALKPAPPVQGVSASTDPHSKARPRPEGTAPIHIT